MSKNTIVIDGVTYRMVESDGDLTLVVLDNWFIFVGKISEHNSGLKLSCCSNVRKWEKGGIGGLSLSKKDSGAVLDPHADIEFSSDRVVYRTVLGENW